MREIAKMPSKISLIHQPKSVWKEPNLFMGEQAFVAERVLVRCADHPYPICTVHEEVLSHLKSTAHVILRADTGAGKSTVLPCLLWADAVLGKIDFQKLIVVTQPRAFAGKQVAGRMATLVGTNSVFWSDEDVPELVATMQVKPPLFRQLCACLCVCVCVCVYVCVCVVWYFSKNFLCVSEKKGRKIQYKVFFFYRCNHPR